jgi:hypothetical protein
MILTVTAALRTSASPHGFIQHCLDVGAEHTVVPGKEGRALAGVPYAEDGEYVRVGRFAIALVPILVAN